MAACIGHTRKRHDMTWLHTFLVSVLFPLFFWPSFSVAWATAAASLKMLKLTVWLNYASSDFLFVLGEMVFWWFQLRLCRCFCALWQQCSIVVAIPCSIFWLFSPPMVEHAVLFESQLLWGLSYSCCQLIFKSSFYSVLRPYADALESAKKFAYPFKRVHFLTWTSFLKLVWEFAHHYNRVYILSFFAHTLTF